MRKGIYLVLTTAVISGFSVFANKIFISTTDPLVFTAVKNTLTGIFLSVTILVSGKYSQLKLLSRRDWMKLIIIGFFGGGLAFGLFFMGLAKIGAVQGSLIHKTLFLWVAILALPFLHERLRFSQIAGYGLIFLSTFVIAGPAQFSFNSGSFLVLCATFLWAIENVLAKMVLRHVSGEIVGWLRMCIGITVLVVMTVILNKGQMFLAARTYSFWPLVTSSLFLTGYVLTWYVGLKRLPAITATAILVLAPIITTVLSGVFLTHTLTSLPQNISFGLLILGVFLVAVKFKKNPTPIIV